MAKPDHWRLQKQHGLWQAGARGEPRFMLRDDADKADAPCNQECEGVRHGTGIQADIMRLRRMEGDAVRVGRYCVYITFTQVLWRLRSMLRRDGLN